MRNIIVKILSISPYQLLNPLKIWWNKWRSKGIIRHYLSAHSERKLHIGCGINLLPGWLNTDLRFEGKRVAFLDAGKKFPFEDETFDYIFSEHVFEHLTFLQSCNMLTECWRVLKPNGKMRTAQPNLGFLFDLFQNPSLALHKEYIAWATSIFTGDVVQSLGPDSRLETYLINNFHTNHGHQIIHTFESFSELLKKFKFDKIRREEVGVSEEITLQGIEKHWTLMPDEKFNRLETMVIEATKMPITATQTPPT